MNEKFKKELRASDIPQWKLAQRAGISEATLVRWFREQLSEERQKRLDEALDSLLMEVKSNGESK